MTLSNHEWKRTTLQGYFKAFCRKTFRWSPAYKAALKRAFVRREGKVEYYKCECCGTIIIRKLKQVDHIDPVIDLIDGWDGSWDKYRERMYVDAMALQVLCKRCHQKKTNKENERRR